MAPLAGTSVLAQKRPLSLSGHDPHPSKRRRQSYQRHHSLHYKPQPIPAAEPAIIEQQALDKLLIDAIKSICEERGARLGIQDPVIESLALEAFRNATEECMYNLRCAILALSDPFFSSYPEIPGNGTQIHALRASHSTHTS
jgi:hypothetical protein